MHLKLTQDTVLAQTQPEVYNEWRALTYRLAYTADDESFGRAAASACDSITDRINKIVGDLFEPGTTPSYNKKLRKIVDAALRLARDLRMQRAVYAFQFIYSGEFDSASMADENGYEDSELDGRQIDIAVCPSLHKWGDQKGANVGSRRPVIAAILTRTRCIAIRWSSSRVSLSFRKMGTEEHRRRLSGAVEEVFGG